MRILTESHYLALLEVARCARPFLRLEQSRSHVADAFYIVSSDGKTGIGTRLKSAMRRLDKTKQPVPKN